MKRIMTMILLVGSPTVFAERFTSTIHSIDYGKGKELNLIRFDNGRVSFVGRKEAKLMEALKESQSKQESIEVEVDKSNNLFAAQSVGAPEEITDDEKAWVMSEEPFRPAVVKNYNAALEIFRKMRRDYRSNGECYSRAHIWAYEEYQRSNLNSMKIFMFFTERYIRRYKFHWWFHVTPMVYVANTRSPRALDRRYTSGPRQTKPWSDIFIKSKRTCKIVKKFDQYWLNQNKEDCYHIYASMYYVIPRDLEKRDLTGVEKTEFVEKEIKRAYRDGFGR